MSLSNLRKRRPKARFPPCEMDWPRTWPKMAAKRAQTGPRWSQDGPRWGQDGAKMEPRGRQERPRLAKMGPRWGSDKPSGAAPENLEKQVPSIPLVWAPKISPKLVQELLKVGSNFGPVF